MINLEQSYKMSKKVISVYVTKIIILLFLLFLILVYLKLSMFFVSLIGLFFIIIFLISLVFLYLDYNFTSFIVSENKITINWGILIKKSKLIPFDTVQNVGTVSRIIDRLFGLVTIKIWTASSSQIRSMTKEKDFVIAPDGRLDLEKEDAEWLKNFITKK